MTMSKKTSLAPVLLLVLAAGHAQRLTGSAGLTCPDSCPDSIRPVCGTDNKAYRNECLLQRAACNSGIRKQNDGPCRKTGNGCPVSCPESIHPVCGTDNKVYRNECTLQRAACNTLIRKKNDGPCVESRKCQEVCPNSYQPVCATNGQTYNNGCLLARAACSNSAIKLHYEGVCPVPVGSSSSSVSRPSGATSSTGSFSSSNISPHVGGVVIGAPVRPFGPGVSTSQSSLPSVLSAPVVNTPRPVMRNCPDVCPPGFRPVCGTDGLVYGSECKLRVAICKNSNLKKKNDGVCVKDCSIQCPVEVNYVCGSDGRTYINDCELTVARCKDPAIKRASSGQCVALRENECQLDNCDVSSGPVCGSNGVTYVNMCQLQHQGCVDETLVRLHGGECQAIRCNRDCSTVINPVCGSDGKTYRNHCILIASACLANSNVVKITNQPCQQR